MLVSLALFLTALCSCSAQDSAPAAPNAAAAHLARGIQMLQRQDPAAAKAQFSAALAGDPHSADALTWRGIAENQLDQYREAARDLEAALRIQPDAVPAQYNLALSFIRLGESDQAIRELRQVLRAKPGAFEPEYNLAILLEQKHATAEAIEHLQAAYQSHPEDSGVLQHLSLDLLAAGRLEDAEKLLSGLQTAPIGALRQVSEALLEAGDYRQAIPLLRSVRMQQPGPQADYLLARACIGAHEDVEAIDLLRPDEGSDPDGEAAYLSGLAQADMGATQEAKTAFEHALQANPRNAHALYHLAQIESTTQETLPQAAIHLQQALRLEPDNPDYGLALGRTLLEQNDASRAKAALQAVHAAGSRAGERDLLLGIAEIIVDGPRQAIPALQSAIAADPSIALSHDMLGFCYFSQGDMLRSAESYARASDLSPATVMFAHSAAVAFEHANNPERALAFAARAAALPDAGAVDHETLGRLLAKAGRREDALRELTKAVSMDPDLEPAYFLLGRTYMQAGNNAQAKIWLDRLKELKSRHQSESATNNDAKPALNSSTLLRGASPGPEPQD